MKVGDKIWFRKIVGGGGKIGWVEHEILSETRISWIIGELGAKLTESWRIQKYKKAEFNAERHPVYIALDENEMRQKDWTRDHGGYRLGDRVARCDDFATVALIEAAISKWEQEKRR